MNIRLLQEWNEDLNNEESEIYKELKNDVEESVSAEFSLYPYLLFSLICLCLSLLLCHISDQFSFIF